MSKIEELKKKIIQDGMSDEDFEMFKLLLRRTRDDFLKNQHCYSTAVLFPKEYSEQAIKLIQYGLETFAGNDSYSRHCYYDDLSYIYFNIGEYDKAYQSLLKAVSIIEESKESCLVSPVSDAIKLLWIKLHVDNFEYSKEAEEHYKCYQKENEFSKALINHKFQMLIAEIIIFLHYKEREKAKLSYNKVLEMMKPEYKGELHSILKKHKCTEKLDITTETMDFLNRTHDILG